MIKSLPLPSFMAMLAAVLMVVLTIMVMISTAPKNTKVLPSRASVSSVKYTAPRNPGKHSVQQVVRVPENSVQQSVRVK